MVGGGDYAVSACERIFNALAPGVFAAPRTQPNSDFTWYPEEYGWMHCGGPGAGHFVKMVHNGIEYGIMQAYAEGFNILHEANAGAAYVAAGDAEVAPMDCPEDYCYDINVAKVAELWRRGSVVGSWLLDLTATVLRGDRELGKYVKAGDAESHLSITCLDVLAASISLMQDIKSFCVCLHDTILNACLLYTSPSPRDLSTSRMPSSA